MTQPYASIPADAYAAPSWARRALILLWLVALPLTCLIYLKIEPSPDQAQFDYMGWLATQGQHFYSGSFDMNWPGAMLLHEAAIRLFGPVAWSWHMLDYLLMQVATGAAALFLWRAGFRLAPFVVLALYPMVYVTAGGWMVGQRDVTAMNLLVVACSAMLSPWHERRALFLAGLLVAAAVLIRPTYLSVLAGLLILEALPRRLVGQSRQRGLSARAGALLAGFALVILATVFWALAVGILDDWYQQSVLFTSQVYYDEPSKNLLAVLITVFSRWWHWLSLGGAVGLVLWIIRDRGIRYPLMLILGLSAAILLSYVVQNKGFAYHLAGFLPLLSMLLAVALDQSSARFRSATAPGGSRWLWGGLGLALTGLVLLVMAGKLAGHSVLLRDLPQNGLAPITGNYTLTADEQAELVRIIRDETTPDERMVQYGTDYQIAYLAQRLPAHRFITPAIDLMHPGFSHYDAWMAEIETGLGEHRPKFVLIEAAALAGTAPDLTPAKPPAPVLTTLLGHLRQDYVPRMQGDFGILFERVAE